MTAHSYPVHADAESESLTDFRVKLARDDYFGAYHPAAEQLQPARLRTERTTFAVADNATNVHLRARRREWKIAWPKAQPRALAEQKSQQFIERPLQIREAYITTH